MNNATRVVAAIAWLSAAALFAAPPVDVSGVREPAWAPDGKRIAVSFLDRLWTMAPDGRQAKRLTSANDRRAEREPAWSPDGKWIAFAADAGDGFDIRVAPARGGADVRVTSMAGDERWPSWTKDGRNAIESWKVRDRATRINDPDRWAIELGDHLTPAHAAGLFKKIDPAKASRAEPQTEEGAPEIPRERIGRGTTGFAVSDADGNMIAVTQTLSTWGGNFYVSKGLGFLYNNHLRSTRTAPNTYGQLLPLVRSSSTSNPTLVFKSTGDGTPGVPRLAVAAAGNAWITSSVFSIIGHVIDGGMPMQRAVEAPRFLVGRDPADPLGTASRIQIEDRIPRATLLDLMKRGHVFQKIGRKGEVRYGYASAVLVDVAAGRVEGGADPRRSHGAAAFEGVKTTTALPQK